jgi:NAD(P)-dependent dehydrogenase (short-subunit alcohol dehydrogenase family)
VDLQLQGEVGVIVGGANGLGRSVAAAFLAEGAHVAVIDRDPEVASIAERIQAEAGSSARCVGFVADVTDYAMVRAASSDVDRAFGRSDHLVFAAAVGSGKFGFPFWNLDPSDWEKVLRVNLIGAANVAHAFAPGMAERKKGSLLFVASVAGQIGSQTDPPYSASKAGLINFAQCAAKDLAPFDVRVNSLCPGMVQTALNRSVYQAWADRQTGPNVPTYDEWAGEKVKAIVPLGRWQTPEDIAAMAVFLASSQARNVTGQTVNVDGGYVMHW